MPSQKAWIEKPIGLVKRGRKRKLLSVDGRIALIKVENVLPERISVIDLNIYRVKMISIRKSLSQLANWSIGYLVKVHGCII